MSLKMDLWGHLGHLLIAGGVLMLGHHCVAGWPLRLSGELIWLGIGVRIRASSVWVWGIIMVASDAYGWWVWGV